MIVDYFDTVYSSINGRSPFATKLKIYSFFRWLIRVVANIVIPISFLLNRRKYCLKITSTTKKEKLIVSLTSFPKRINRLWMYRANLQVPFLCNLTVPTFLSSLLYFH